jgi:hypothetical protein
LPGSREIHSLRVLWSKIRPHTPKLCMPEKYVRYRFRSPFPPLSALRPPYRGPLNKYSVSRAFHYMSVGVLLYSILKRNHFRFLPHSPVTLIVTQPIWHYKSYH